MARLLLHKAELCTTLSLSAMFILFELENNSEREVAAERAQTMGFNLNLKPKTCSSVFTNCDTIFAIKFPSISSERDADQAVERHARDLPLKRGCKEYLPSCGKLDDAANFDKVQPMQGVITGLNSTNERACLHARDFIIDASLKQQAHDGLEASVCSVAQRARAVAAEGMR